LTKGGLTHDSYLIPVKDVDLEQALTKGVDCKLADVISIYKLIDGAKTWGDIQRDLELAKSEWVPVMFNLISCGLVQISTTPTKSTRQSATVIKMDWQTVQAFEQSICRTDTGLYTQPSLLYFLSQEWFKYEVMEVPFSLLVFGFANKTEPHSQLIPFRTRAIEDLRQKVFKTKRKYDLLCHFGAFSYAMLLPLSTRSSAHRQAEILAEICATIVVSEDYERDNIEFRAGIANIPEDCNTLDDLLTLAERLNVLGG
jgi:predicted transcriptional regulator